MIQVRVATMDDAVEAIEVVRQSISFLCVADHRNDPATLDRWLANKTPESFAAWINDPENFCVVEEAEGKIRGIGLLRRNGEVLLFYVAPGHQRKGVGRRIHDALEAHAIGWGLAHLHLESTAAARSFYQSLGYQAADAQRPLFGVLRAYPYAKPLQPDPSAEDSSVPNLRVVEIKAFIPAKDFALSKRFYTDFGFVMASDGGGVAYFHCGEASFLLQDFYVEALANNLMMHLLVEDVDAWHARVVEAKLAETYGVKIGEVEQQPWRMRDFVVTDPSGVLWRIGQNTD